KGIIESCQCQRESVPILDCLEFGQRYDLPFLKRLLIKESPFRQLLPFNLLLQTIDLFFFGSLKLFEQAEGPSLMIYHKLIHRHNPRQRGRSFLPAAADKMIKRIQNGLPWIRKVYFVSRQIGAVYCRPINRFDDGVIKSFLMIIKAVGHFTKNLFERVSD